MTEPTDAEISDVARKAGLLPDNSHPAPETRAARKHSNAVQAFARAVLAKWGTPAGAGEPVAEVQTMMQGGNAGIATVIREIYNPHRDPLPPGTKLYTTPQPTQAQAGAITPPPVECNTEELKRAYAFGWWSALEKQRETAQAGAVPEQS